MKALLFGSVGTLAETSGLQRDCFNAAFVEHGLDWYWDEQLYKSLLTKAGGVTRIQSYARQVGRRVDAHAVHATKSEIFQRQLERGIPLRSGVAATIAKCHADGVKLGLVTTTSSRNVQAILAATGLSARDFEVIVTDNDVNALKPAPDAFHVALHELGFDASDAIAIEDNPDGYASACAAGLETLVFAGAYHEVSSFPPGANIVHVLDLLATKLAA